MGQSVYEFVGGPWEMIPFLIIRKPSGQRYVFTWPDWSSASIALLLETFGRFAADPELDFNWYDAAVLSSRIGREAYARQCATTKRSA